MRLTRLMAFTFLVTPCAAQSLVAHYKLDETSGTTCADSSGNNLDGMYRNSYTLGQTAPAASCGTAVAFDPAGLTDVIIPGGPPLQTLTFDLTVSAWVNPNVIPPQGAARRVFGNNNNGWMCGLHGDGMIFTTRFIQDYVLGGLNIPAATWTHIAFVFDVNFDVTFYVNGLNVGTVTGSAPANSPAPDWFIAGFNGAIEFFNGQIDDVQVYSGSLTDAEIMGLFSSPCSTLGSSGSIGSSYCAPAIMNSTGAPAIITALGSTNTADNNVTLLASQLPDGQFGYFLNSMTQGFIPNPGSSQGNLCLSGGIGRYNPAAGYPVQSSGTSGSISIALDLGNTPTPAGFASVLPGQTWNFQCWYRDLNPGTTSNFTDGTTVTFQ